MTITVKSAWKWFDLGIKEDEADLADNDVVVTGAVVPFACEVKEVWVGQTVLPTTGTLAVYKAASTDVNLLAAATVNLASGPAAYVGAKQTLGLVPLSLKLAAGDILKAVWTLTNITVTDDSVFSCMVGVEPASE